MDLNPAESVYKVFAITVLGLVAFAFNEYSPYENSYDNTLLSGYNYAGLNGFSVSPKLHHTAYYLGRLIMHSSRDAVRRCMLIGTTNFNLQLPF